MSNPFSIPVKGECKVEDIMYWCYEREVIRLQKVQGVEAPWTTDPILSAYRFCNVDRRDDRVTQWLIDNVYSKYSDMEDLWLIAIICRLVNWPPTLQKLFELYTPKYAEEFDAGYFASSLQYIADNSEKVYGGAYVTYPGREPGVKKSEFFAYKVLPSLVERRELIRDAINRNFVELSVLEMSSGFGVSTFMSGQAISDLTYVEGQLDKAEDLHTYAPQGPGSISGMNRLFDRAKGASWSKKDFNSNLIDVRNHLVSELGFDKLSLHSVQNVFCEMDKYWRVLNEEGRPRTKYTPETSF